MLIPHLKKYFGFYSLIFIVFIISLINYKPGTYLTGWDTLHPEFDFALNFKRLLSGVWRNEQGLGAVTAHSHMADLPRVIFLWFSHLFVPLSFVRYSYVFLCLIMGPLGIYFLTHLLLKHKASRINEFIAFLTGLFYVFNLGTVQQFFVPFEMFTTQYAALPWIVVSSLRYLEKPTGKNLLFFAVVALLSTPQAYAAHLWYAFFAIYLGFLFCYFILYRNLKSLKRASILVIFTLLINAFWLLPNLYFVKTSSYIPIEAKQTRLFAQEYGLRNREHGYLKDVALIRGFYYNWSIFNFEKERPEFLMLEWRNHYKKPINTYLGYFFFGTAIIGLLYSLIKKEKRYLSFFPFFALPFIFLMNHTPPFEKLFDFLIQYSIFDQALRFVFTKFSIFLIFAYSIYFSYFTYIIFSKFRKKNIIYGFTIIASLMLVFYALPIIKGQLISDKVRIKFPEKYFQFWDFMNTQPDGTVLTLPLHTFSGWQYFDWQYQGSGFIWFGMNQPVLDRDFDRWNVQNEQAYRELKYSLYARNTNFFLFNLKKFNIHYIVWDKSNITTSLKNRPQIIYDRESELLLSQMLTNKSIQQIANFSGLIVYKVNQPDPSNQQIQNLTLVTPEYRWNNLDYAYLKIGPYYSPKSGTNVEDSYHFPLRNMIKYDDKLKLDAYAKLINNRDGDKEDYSAEHIKLVNGDSPGVTLIDSPNGKFLNFKSKNILSGVGLNFYYLPHDKGYILSFLTRNVKGLPLRFCLRNIYSSLCDSYDELSRNKEFAYDHLYLPPSDRAIGYDLTIDNLSYGDYESENELIGFSITPISNLPIESFEQIGKPQNEQIFVLNKSFNSGWSAYKTDNGFFGKSLPLLFGKKLTDHVLVNNWANGWKIDQETINSNNNLNFTVIFWPQYLQFIGFIILVGSFFWIIITKRNKEHS